MTGKVSFTIDGVEVTANKGDTILKAALEHDIYIPHLCYHPDLKPFGGCRLCMVEIQGKGLRKPSNQQSASDCCRTADG
jgi:NADH dehydrogenase/NADH:ubiquinone oxidoreductase subunit G